MSNVNQNIVMIILTFEKWSIKYFLYFLIGIQFIDRHKCVWFIEDIILFDVNVVLQ